LPIPPPIKRGLNKKKERAQLMGEGATC
jgi:hypothetical protein